MFIRKDSIVFTSARIGQLEIKNRLVRSATYENAATSKGEVSDFLVDLYRTLAKGGVGLVITGIAGVYSKALAPHLVVRADDDSFIPSLEKIPRAVREVAPDCRVMLQLQHPGRQVINREDAAKLVPVLPPALVAYIRKHPEVMLPPKEVILVAYTNREVLERSVRTRIAAFWSTSRRELWIKGKTSGHFFELTEVRVNCEQNSLVYLVRPKGEGICHTRNSKGTARNCYYRRLNLETGALESMDP